MRSIVNNQIAYIVQSSIRFFSIFFLHDEKL